MATIYKRGKRWHALIRRKGLPTSDKSFPTRKVALIWARDIESKLDRGLITDITKSSRVTMTELFSLYKQKVSKHKRNAACESYMLTMLAGSLGDLKLTQLTRETVSDFRDARLAEGKSPSTVRNNLQLLSAVITTSMRDWGYELPYNPVHRITKPRVDNARNRRLKQGEVERLLEAADKGQNPAVRPLILLALETAMRLGELLSLEWENINIEQRTAFLPTTKNGRPRAVPLSAVAVSALQSVERNPGDARVFNSWCGVGSFHHIWSRLLNRANIKGLRFHDLRHEAASRFAEIGMDIMRISAITGHTSLQMLKRYTHFRSIDLARELDEKSCYTPDVHKQINEHAVEAKVGVVSNNKIPYDPKSGRCGG